MGSSALSPELGYQPFRVTELFHIAMNGLENNVSGVLHRYAYRKVWQAPKSGKITGQGRKLSPNNVEHQISCSILYVFDNL